MQLNSDEIQQMYIMTSFHTAVSDTLEIHLMDHLYPDMLAVNTRDDIQRWWEVMPGVLIIEALAQTGAVALLSEEKNKGHIALFAGIKNAKFKAQVTPGDVLSLSCEIIARKGPVGVGKAEAYVDGKLAVSAELTFAIE